MRSKSFVTSSPAETEVLGQILARELQRTDIERDGAFSVLLAGELGSGKTTFAKGFARGLGIEDKILSPTFVLMKPYPLAGSFFRRLWHIDCYRLKEPEELLVVGFDHIRKNRENLLLIEWPEKIHKLIPKKSFSVAFKNRSALSRQLTFSI